MMLLHLGEIEAAEELINAIETVLGRSDPSEITPDLGGKGSTQTLGAAVLRVIREGN
jgi:tartrate dehydrogenase/decarboxylase / D-malate dehydrogenase